MKRAMPTATGTAMIMASALERIVPQATAAMPQTDGVESGNQVFSVRKFVASARMAGIDFQTRNPPMPTMITRRRMLAPPAMPAKIRSPKRSPRSAPSAGPSGVARVAWPRFERTSVAGRGPGSVLMSALLVWRTVVVRVLRYGTGPGRPRSRTARTVDVRSSGDLGDGGLDLLLDLGGQWRVAEVRELGLPRRARGVGQEGLGQRGLVRGEALDAGDLVRDEQDGVGARCLGRVVELQGQVVPGAGDLGHGDGLAHVLRGELHRTATVVDLRDAEAVLLREAVLDVGHGVRGLLHDRRDAVRPLGALAARRLPLLVVVVGPVRNARGRQVLREVVRRAGGVRPVDGRDGRGRQCRPRVQLGDRRVVPRLDLATED